jgi:hypothetical protein
MKQLIPMRRVFLEKMYSSAGIEVSSHLLKPMTHYLVHKNLPPIPILSHMNPIHIPKPSFPKIHFNIILPSTHIFRVVSSLQAFEQKFSGIVSRRECSRTLYSECCIGFHIKQRNLSDRNLSCWLGVNALFTGKETK